MISAGDLVVGLAFLAGTLGLCAFGAWRIVRGRWEGVESALAFGVLFSTFVVFAHLIPGAFGVLTTWTALLTAALLVLTTKRLGCRIRGQTPDAASRDAAGLGVIAPVGLLAVGACVAAFLRETAGTVVTGLDATTFHVPLVARFMQTDSVWGLHQWLPDYSNATYPAHGNLLLLSVVQPFEHAFLATLVSVPFMALTGLAAYALGRRLGASAPASALAAAALLAVPRLGDISLGTAVTDAPTVAFLGAAMVFGLRERREDLLLAGLALGMAVGTKWYGLSYAAVLVLLWLVARRRVQGLPGALGVGAAAGAFWFVRNWVETGNPVFPVDSPLFDAPRDVVREVAGYTLAHYLTDFDAWEEHIGPAFERGLGWPAAALLIAAVSAAAMTRRGPVPALTLAGIGLTAAYFVTPYSAFGPEGNPFLTEASTRYALPALVAFAGPAACLLSRSWVLRVVVGVAVAEGLRRGFPGLSVGELLVGALLALTVYGLWRAPRPLAATAAVLALLGGLEILRQRANDASYSSYSRVYAPLQRTDTKVGLASPWPLSDVAPVLPAFGERLRNEVDYLGVFRGGFLREATDLDFGDSEYVISACVECDPTRQALDAGFRIVARDDPLVLLRR